MTIYNANVDLVNGMCIHHLVKFCPFILKILKKQQLNYDGMTDRENDGQCKNRIAPTFSKRGYNKTCV